MFKYGMELTSNIINVYYLCFLARNLQYKKYITKANFCPQIPLYTGFSNGKNRVVIGFGRGSRQLQRIKYSDVLQV